MIRKPVSLLVLLTALNFVNYLDRFVLAAVLPRVEVDLALSKFQAGLLYTAFLSVFLLTCPLFGALGDRVPRKYLLAFGAFVWSAATLASGLSSTLTTLLIARAFVGVGEASFTTLAPTLIDEIAPDAKRGRWLSIFHIAGPLGSALGYIVGGAVEKSYGWHAAFFVAGVPGILLGAAMLLIAEPERKASEAASISFMEALRILGRLPLFRKAVAGYTALTFSMGAFAVWAPSFLVQRFTMPLASTNFTFGIVTVLAGALATLLGGQLGDRAKRSAAARTVQVPDLPFRSNAPINVAESDDVTRSLLRLCAWGSAFAAVLCAAAFLAPGPKLFFTGAFFCELGVFFSNAPINTVLLRSVPKAIQGRAMAVSILCIHLFGDLSSPALLGLAQDLAGPAKLSLAMMPLAVVFGLSAILWWPGGSANRTQIATKDLP
jgi:MFS transporter, Spinster family, sphingosine-1-phosphate transporter